MKKLLTCPEGSATSGDCNTCLGRSEQCLELVGWQANALVKVHNCAVHHCDRVVSGFAVHNADSKCLDTEVNKCPHQGSLERVVFYNPNSKSLSTWWNLLASMSFRAPCGR